jgi:tRNA(adenine34) deaminase
LHSNAEPAKLTSVIELVDERETVDHRWMGEALRVGQQAADHGDVPVGAVVVLEGRIVGVGGNRREIDADPTGHAEIVALREACRNAGRWRVDGATLYVTLEPCPMCAGAIVAARVARLVYGADDPKAGAVRTLYRICDDPRLNHRVEVRGGVRADEGGRLLREFFAGARQRPRRREHG